MEKIVEFSEFQKATSDDLNEIGAFSRDSLDHVVHDGIDPLKAYWGFNTVKTAQTVVTVGLGRYYNGGQVFFRDDDGGIEIDFVLDLPVVTKRIATIVVAGSLPTNTKTEQREFLTDVVNRTTEARAVATESWRIAQVSRILGNESAAPTPFPPDSNVLAVAYVTLNSTGVESIEMIEANRLKNVRETHDLAEEVGEEIEDLGPRLATLEADMAALRNALKSKADMPFVQRIAFDTARTKEKLDLPDDYNDYGADFFLDEEESDPAFSGYKAKINEALRFPSAADNGADGEELALANPLDANIKNSSGLILPAWDEIRWRQIRGNSGNIALNQFNYEDSSIVHANMARTRMRFGEEFYVSASSSWWGNGRWTDPASFIFTKNGEEFQALPTNQTDASGVVIYRVAKRWRDTIILPYWTRTSGSPEIFGGYPWVQTFLVAQDIWVVGLGVPFPQLGTTGDVTFLLCEVTESGTPDFNNVLNYVTVPRASLRLGGAAGGNNPRYAFPPTFLKAGKRYGCGVITPGNHNVAVTDASQYLDGTLFFRNNSGFWQSDPAHNFMVDIGIASFRAARCEILFDPIALAGGIASLDILADMIVPDSTQLEWEVQVAGVWKTFDPSQPSPLTPLPATIGLRAILTGSRGMHPGITLPGSVVKVSRPDDDFRHVSVARTLAAASTTITVKAVLERFDEAHHDAVLKVRSGSTEYSASSVSDLETLIGTIERTGVFSVPSTTSIRTIVEGATDNVNNLFHVSQVDYVATA